MKSTSNSVVARSYHGIVKATTVAMLLQQMALCPIAKGNPLSAKERMLQLQANRKAQCASLISKAAEKEAEKTAEAYEKRTQKLQEAVGRLFKEAEKLDASEHNPTAQNRMMERLLEDVGAGVQFDLLEQTSAEFNSHSQGLKEVQDKFKAIMTNLNIAASEARGMGEGKIKRGLRELGNWLGGKEKLSLNEALENARNDMNDLVGVAGEIADKHYGDVLKMESTANEHIAKAEFLNDMFQQLTETIATLEAQQLEFQEAGVDVTTQNRSIDIFKRIRSNVQEVQEVHLEIADEFLKLADQGFELNKALKGSQIAAQIAILKAFNKMGAQMSNLIAVETVGRMLDVINTLDKTAGILGKNVATRTAKNVKEIIANGRKRMKPSESQADKVFNRSIADLKKHEAEVEAKRPGHIEELKKSVAKNKQLLQKHAAEAMARTVVGKMAEDAEVKQIWDEAQQDAQESLKRAEALVKEQAQVMQQELEHE